MCGPQQQKAVELEKEKHWYLLAGKERCLEGLNLLYMSIA